MPQSAQKSLIARLPSGLLASTDEATQFFVGWWRRMHQRRNPLVAVALKFVEWAEEGAASQRYVWEVCRWPQGRSVDWMFLCWMIDGRGVWMKQFPSKRAAMAYFRQAPDAVMARAERPAGDDVHEGVQA